MFVTALLLGLVGVFCILDSRILGRMNFERPLITCTIVGALLGDLQTGLTLGASIELMSLGIVNIGAAAPPDMNMAAIICAAFAILTDASAETALALAIPIAVLGQMLGVLMRTILSNLTHVADHAIAEGKFRKAWSMHIVWGHAAVQPDVLYPHLPVRLLRHGSGAEDRGFHPRMADRWPEPRQ